MSDVENKHGYLLLSIGPDEEALSPFLIKANKIVAMRELKGRTRIYIEDKEFHVFEDIDEILAQLDSIHPSLR